MKSEMMQLLDGEDVFVFVFLYFCFFVEVQQIVLTFNSRTKLKKETGKEGIMKQK